MESIAVVGAGSWGTTLADLLARKGLSVRLWVREDDVCRGIRETRENQTFLPGVKLSDNITPNGSLEETLSGADLIVSAVPTHVLRGVFKEASAFIPGDALIVSVSKGIEEGTYLTPTGILKEVLPGHDHDLTCALSGPTFAKEVSAGLPAAATIASNSEESAQRAQQVFSTESFRVYTGTDLCGVEYGGALKNVMALASGISDGLELGCNARAALITRGLAEISRLGVTLGAEPSTFYGLSGLGDLVLTCTGTLSRNHTVGVALGRGRSLKEILSEMKMVAEGVKTTVAARELAVKKGVEMPITQEMYSVLYEGKPAAEAATELMTRRLKGE